MKSGYYAGIDIGTNGARLVIKDAFYNENRELEAVEVNKVRVPLRLGADVYSIGELSERKIRQLSLCISSFRDLMNIYDVVSYSCLATSAMREAKNGAEVIERIKKETGVQISIIDGETEAKTISKIAKDFKLDDDKYVFIDVGGGSTEVTLVSKGKAIESTSFELGTLRILAHKDKKETWGRYEDLLDSYHDKYGNLDIVGTGGNINRYWKMSKKKSNKKDLNYLSVEELNDIYNELSKYTPSQRMAKYDMKPDRADVIIPAGNIFKKASEILKSKTIYVPMIGLSDSIVDTLIENYINVL